MPSSVIPMPCNESLQVNNAEAVAKMKAYGCMKISSSELEKMLGKIGYRISHKDSFDYTNTSNEISFNARSVCIVEGDTGLHFNNPNTRRDNNFRKLQKIRNEFFVFENDRIWEL